MKRTRCIAPLVSPGLASVILGVLSFATLQADSLLRWESGPGYRSAALPPHPGDKPGFTFMPPSQAGILFTNRLSIERAAANQNLLNGSGVAAGDYDGDGWVDLYFCNKEGGNALYRNLGNWQFEEVTGRTGTGCAGMSSSAAVFGDINGDGLLDLLVTSYGGSNAVFLNLGQGGFSNITASAGLTLKAGLNTLALADVDGNGTLDVYVCNYGEMSIQRTGGAISTRTVNGKTVVTGRYANRLKIIDGQLIEFGEPHVLYLNDGKGHFTPASWTDGTFLDEEGRPLKAAPWDMGLTAMFRDLNGDGFPDLYVCNDFQTPDRVWINDGKGHFRAIPREALRQSSHFSMGIDVGDLDRDGQDDFFVVDMLSRVHALRMTQLDATNPPTSYTGEAQLDRPQYRHNTLFHNRGDGTYAEIAHYAGLHATDWSWCPVFLDVDLDGYEDLLVGNGHAFDTQDLDTMRSSRGAGKSMQDGVRILKQFPFLVTPNYAFRNRGDLRFEEVGTQWGFNAKEVTHGLILADLDNDGDLDVVGSCLNAAPLLYRNNCPASRLAVRLRGKAGNIQGLGAKIQVLGGPVPQSQEVVGGGRYLSGDDPVRVFATGKATGLTLKVTWRNGTQSVIEGVKPNRFYEVNEAGARPSPTPATAPGQSSREPAPWFTDVSDRLNHRHHESIHDDRQRQRLLPYGLGRMGPGVSWFDLDGDGHDELLIGCGKGGSLAAYRPRAQGPFVSVPLSGGAMARDSATLLGWASGKERRILVGTSSYEEESATNGPGVLCLEARTGAVQEQKNFNAVAAGGAMAMADLDGNGYLDLFVGGHYIGGRYPETTPSLLYHNTQGTLVVDTANSALLSKVQRVRGSVFTDLDGDGFPELVLACEWGPVRVFKNNRGSLSEITTELGLGELTGWWTGVATGDFDGDGRMDILAGNWGLNTSYQVSPGHPVSLFYGEYNGDDSLELIEAYDELTPGKIVPRRSLAMLSPVMPFLEEKFPTHKSYSQATVKELLGDRLKTTRQLEARTLSSTLFLNRGDKFEAVALPREAQFAPAFAVAVADLDGDGKEDLFLSQNYFDVLPNESRHDAGRGLVLRGDGSGKLTPVPGQQSGIKVYGEQRGAALGDFNEDGRVDLVVSQNAEQTCLFENRQAQPGLRIRLAGPENNPLGIGATLRLGHQQKLGPAREVQAGSGYWSQNSSVTILGPAAGATELWVRWPGGQALTYPIPAQAREISVDLAGKVTVLK